MNSWCLPLTLTALRVSYCHFMLQKYTVAATKLLNVSAHFLKPLTSSTEWYENLLQCRYTNNNAVNL